MIRINKEVVQLIANKNLSQKDDLRKILINEFAKRLKNSLKCKNITQSELADKIHMSKNAVSLYCNGKNRPPLHVLILICKALDESADYLLGLED